MPSVGDLGTLAVTLGAKTADFRKDLREARGELTETESSMRGLIGTAGKLGVAAVAAGAAIVIGLVHSGLEAIDAQAKLARQLDGTIDGLRGLEIAAQDAGVGQDELEGSMKALNARLGEAQRQAGPARQMFDALGLSAQALSKLDVDQRLAAIADRVHDLGLSATQTGDLLRTLGVRSGEMVDFMRQGGEAIRSAREEVDDFGLSVSEIDAAKVEAANDAFERLGRMLEGVRNQFAIALAPIIGEVAERINGLVKANGGWADSTRTTVEGGIRGFAKVADVVQGLRVALKGAEVIGIGFGAAIVSVAQIAAEAFTKTFDLLRSGVSALVDELNMLPGVELKMRGGPLGTSEFMKDFRGFADEIRDKVGASRAELHELAMQEMPSSRVESFFKAVEDHATAAATATVAARHELQQTAEGAGFAVEEDPELKKQREKLQQRLDAVRDSVASELELEQMRYAERAAILEEALAKELLTEQQYDQVRADLEVQHMNDLAEIRKKGLTDLEKFTSSSFKQQASSVIGALVNMTAGVSQQSRAMFEINKAAGIANAIVSTAEGVTKALAAYPPPISFVMAGLQAAAGLAQVQAIRSTTFGGGGGVAPALAGGTAAPPVSNVGPGQAANQTPARQTIALEGITEDQLFSGKSVRGLIKRLQEAQADGAVLVLD